MLLSKSKKVLILLLSVTALLVLSFGFVFLMPNFSPKEGKTTYLLLPDNTAYSEVVDQLEEKTDIFSTLSFNLAAKMLKFSEVKSGRYKISSGMNNFKLIRALKNGIQTPVQLRINNIRTKEQLAGKLAAQLMTDSVKFLSLLNDTAFLSGINLNPSNSISVFLPNTYEIFWNTNEKKLFERMNREYEKFWTDTRKQLAAAIPLTPGEVITLASIVDEETNSKNEKSIVAGLYINRLKKRMPLQADPTIKFAMGDFTIKRVLYVHLQTDSPYNTYKYAGLPPGPIRIPNLETIDAVLNYYKSNYLYMCAKETLNGEHNFAANWAEHQQNAAKYQKALNERGIK